MLAQAGRGGSLEEVQLLARRAEPDALDAQVVGPVVTHGEPQPVLVEGDGFVDIPALIDTWWTPSGCIPISLWGAAAATGCALPRRCDPASGDASHRVMTWQPRARQQGRDGR